MNVALWIVAGLLAACFIASGAMKLQPKDKVVESGADFLEGFSPAGIKAIAMLEILGGIGLVLPAVLDVAPVLVPVAAVGLALMVLGAVVVQLRRQDTRAMVLNAALFVLVGFLMWGRLGPESFTG